MGKPGQLTNSALPGAYACRTVDGFIGERAWEPLGRRRRGGSLQRCWGKENRPAQIEGPAVQRRSWRSKRIRKSRCWKPIFSNPDFGVKNSPKLALPIVESKFGAIFWVHAENALNLFKSEINSLSKEVFQRCVQRQDSRSWKIVQDSEFALPLGVQESQARRPCQRRRRAPRIRSRLPRKGWLSCSRAPATIRAPAVKDPVRRSTECSRRSI